MQIEVKITAPDGGDPIPVIRAMLENHPGLQSRSVLVDSGHAGWVEFGTDPAKKRDSSDSSKGPGEPTEVQKRIREWYRVKNGLSALNGNDLVKADGVYHAIMKNGMLPHPYLRPATYDILDSVSASSVTAEQWLDMRHKDPMNELCELIAEEARNLLDMNDDVYSGELKDSIEVVSPDDITETSPASKAPDSVWSDPTLAGDGRRHPGPGWMGP